VGKELVFFLCIRVRSSLCILVTPAVPYMSTGLAGCLVGPRISCGTHKVVRTLRIIKKKERQLVALFATLPAHAQFQRTPFLLAQSIYP
jgi:hypothetical protein